MSGSCLLKPDADGVQRLSCHNPDRTTDASYVNSTLNGKVLDIGACAAAAFYLALRAYLGQLTQAPLQCGCVWLLDATAHQRESPSGPGAAPPMELAPKYPSWRVPKCFWVTMAWASCSRVEQRTAATPAADVVHCCARPGATETPGWSRNWTAKAVPRMPIGMGVPEHFRQVDSQLAWQSVSRLPRTVLAI